VQTRDKVNFRKRYYHHFYGPNLVKLLFKVFMMPDQQVLRSRYHYDFPLTVRNPMTNGVIVGEVEFYLIDQSAVASATEQLLCSSGSEVSAFE